MSIRQDYYQRQADKADRLHERAKAKAREGEDRMQQGRDMMSVIPMGQPILVGHHSEQRDRNYRKRAHDSFMKGGDMAFKEAPAIAARAENAEKAASGQGAISSDAPDAADRITAELESLEKAQAMMKACNAAIRKTKHMPEPERVTALMDLGLSEERAIELLKPDFAGRIGFASYSLSNNSANIRRYRQRLAKQLELDSQMDDEPTVITTGAGVEVEVCPADNRVRIRFPVRTSREFYRTIRSRGFVWSRTNEAFQRKISHTAFLNAKELARLFENE